MTGSVESKEYGVAYCGLYCLQRGKSNPTVIHLFITSAIMLGVPTPVALKPRRNLDLEAPNCDPQRDPSPEKSFKDLAVSS
jgi:hypothetical protein